MITQSLNYTCDRCGEKRTIATSDTEAYNWGKMLAAQANGPKWLGSNKGGAALMNGIDLCPQCMESLMNWFKTPQHDPHLDRY